MLGAIVSPLGQRKGCGTRDVSQRTLALDAWLTAHPALDDELTSATGETILNLPPHATPSTPHEDGPLVAARAER
jgi:hypothetical protein